MASNGPVENPNPFTHKPEMIESKTQKVEVKDSIKKSDALLSGKLVMKYLSEKSTSEALQLKAFENLKESIASLPPKIIRLVSEKCADPKVKIAQAAVETCWECLENGSISGETMHMEVMIGFLNAVSNIKVAPVRISGARYLVDAAIKFPGMQSEAILSRLEKALDSPKCSSGAVLLA